jgi:signal transduction histidine kinase
MSAPSPKSPVASPPVERTEDRAFLQKQRKLASGILSRRILRLDDLSPAAWWQHQITGYLFAVLLIAASTLIAVQFDRALEPHFFAGAIMIVMVFVVTLLWGPGPAVFATALSTAALDYFLISPVSNLHFWNDLEDLLPFIVASLVISLLAAQRERARRRARTAERLATERAQALEEADKLKDQFLSLASHELKTPITAIKGYAQLADRRLRSAPDSLPGVSAAQEVLTKINQQADRLTGLVNDLLDVSRIQAGKLELRLEICDLAVLCRQSVEEHALTNGRTIDLDLPARPVFVSADSERIGQVLSNLLINAFKYSAADRPVRVALTCHLGKALVSVEDDGVGIPKDELPLIFERFFRARTARNGPQRGVGLGLAICKEIVERHHGRIWAESEEGKGSRFAVELPLARELPAEKLN